MHILPNISQSKNLLVSKESELFSPPHFVNYFSRKMFLFYYPTKFYRLIAFTYSEIGQYLYRNGLIPRL